MKTLILITLSTLLAISSYAQDNPYAIFGYKQKVKPKPSPVDIYKINNHDPKSNIRYMIINRENRVIKLLDDRDSVIKTISYTDQDILRWVAVDPYAKKYPSMSPYNYAGNNPIRNIDMNGDSIRTTGSATATASMKQVAEAGIGNNGSMTQASNGNWTLSQTDDQALNMTDQQADTYKVMSNLISDTHTSSYNLVDGNDAISSQIILGNNGAYPGSPTPGVHTLDMGDIKQLGSDGAITGQGTLVHEFTEGSILQKIPGTPSGRQVESAHGQGIAAENLVNGTQRTGGDTTVPNATGGTTLNIPVFVNNQLKVITIDLHNNNFNASDVKNNNNNKN